MNNEVTVLVVVLFSSQGLVKKILEDHKLLSWVGLGVFF